jgi:hypothetical protein
VLSARVLETKRIAETNETIRELLSQIARPGKNPGMIYTMWKNYPDALCDYGNILAKELIIRGFRMSKPFPYQVNKVPYCLPGFFGRESYHSANRKFLLTTNPNYYTKFFVRSA